MKTAITTHSTLAAFVLGDIKGGDAAHAYRMTVIRTAIEQGFKGNYAPLAESLALTVGKSAKHAAYRDAFAAAGVVADPTVPHPDQADGSIVRKVAYVGKLDAPENRAAKQRIEQYTARATEAFGAAFVASMEATKAANKVAGDAKKAEKAAAAEAAQAATINAAASAAAADGLARGAASVELSEHAAAVLSAIKTGALDDASVTALYEAITAHYAASALANAELVAA